MLLCHIMSPAFAADSGMMLFSQDRLTVWSAVLLWII